MYNYQEEMHADILEYIRDNFTQSEQRARLEDRAAWEEELNDLLWIEDSVTGNASGSYTFNTWRAREYVLDNMELLRDMIAEFDIDSDTFTEKFINDEWEYFDVSIRCYLLSQAIASALDELEEEQNHEKDNIL